MYTTVPQHLAQGLARDNTGQPAERRNLQTCIGATLRREQENDIKIQGVLPRRGLWDEEVAGVRLLSKLNIACIGCCQRSTQPIQTVGMQISPLP